MYVGKHDTIVPASDSLWAKEQLGKAVVQYKEIDGGHSIFFVAKDATFF